MDIKSVVKLIKNSNKKQPVEEKCSYSEDVKQTRYEVDLPKEIITEILNLYSAMSL